MLPAESQERGKGYEGGACDRVIWIILDLLKHIELESRISLNALRASACQKKVSLT